MSLLSFFCMMYSSDYLIGCILFYGHIFVFCDMMCYTFYSTRLFTCILLSSGLTCHGGYLGSEIWLREFEIVLHLLMIRAVPCSLPAPCLCMTFPSSIFLALHISSLIRPGRVWGVWAQGWSGMARVGLWYLGGLRCEDWSIAWWDCHLFFREYRDWSCMVRVVLWWAVVLDEITVYFAWWVRLIHDSRGLMWLYQMDIDL